MVWGGGYSEGSKEEVKEVAGVRKEKGRLAVPLCQERCHVREALLHLCHVIIDQCVRVYTSEYFLYDSACPHNRYACIHVDVGSVVSVPDNFLRGTEHHQTPTCVCLHLHLLGCEKEGQ